jgi:hypothetical protein
MPLLVPLPWVAPPPVAHLPMSHLRLLVDHPHLEAPFPRARRRVYSTFYLRPTGPAPTSGSSSPPHLPFSFSHSR